MTVPVMRTSLKVGDLSIPITEIFNNNDGYVRNELDPILLNPSQPKMHFKQKKKMELNGLLPVEKKPSVQASATSAIRSGTMKCPHTIDKSDGTKADCQYVTNRIGNYRRHEKDMHINVNIVECCNLRFLYRADFRLHATENHNGGKEFQCLECPATFIRRALLVRHLSVHDPSRKNHKCELCPYSTSHATNLQRHYRVHENEVMAVNWDGQYEEEAMEEYGGDDEHSFYQYNPYLYESENMQMARTDTASGKRKRLMEEDCSTETPLSMKMPMIADESEQNISKSHRRNNYEEEERISSDNFSVNSTEEVKEEQHSLLDNPSYYYPSFISFPNWHPILFRNGPSGGFNGLPSLDSALSARAPHRNEPFSPHSALSTRGPSLSTHGPVPRRTSLATRGPELQKSSLSILAPISPACAPSTHRPELQKSSFSTPGQIPQKSTLSTNGPVHGKSSFSTPEQIPQKSSLSTHGPVPQKNDLPTLGPVPQKNSLSTLGPVPQKNSLSTLGPVPQKSSLSTHGPVAQESSLSTHGTVAQESSLSTHGPVAQESSFSTHGPVAQESYLSAHGPVAQESTLSMHGTVAQESSLSTHGPVAQESSLSTHGPVAQESSLSTHGPVAQESYLSTHGPVAQESGVSTPVSATVRCSQPAGPAWISTYDDNRPDVKPQFSESEEHVLSSQYQLSDGVAACDQGASQYHLSDRVHACRHQDPLKR